MTQVASRTEVDAETARALDIARDLVRAGVPVFVAPPCPTDCTSKKHKPGQGTGGSGFHLPLKWETSTPTLDVVDRWRPRWALCAVMGQTLDLLDTDPRNGGDATAAGLKAAGMWPRVYAVAGTPSDGIHEFVAPLGVGSRDAVRDGFDVKGGEPDGSSRGFAFIAPTVKKSKTTGNLTPYRWIVEPDLDALAEGGDDTGQALAELVRQAKGSRKAKAEARDHQDGQGDGPVPEGKRYQWVRDYAGYLIEYMPRLTWPEYETLCRLRWEACEQPPKASYEWTWTEARTNPVLDCWDRYRERVPDEEPAPTAEAVPAAAGVDWVALDADLWAGLDAVPAPTTPALPGVDGEQDDAGEHSVAPTGDPADGGEEVPRGRVLPIDWATFLTRDLGEIDWLPGQILARGQQAALVGKGKAGKSLLAIEWAWRAAAGLPFLGDDARAPISILYVDRENSDDDVQERLLSLGATVEQLANLRYVQFPHYRPLDTIEGGGDLLVDVEEYGAELVFLDTVSRYVKGKENDSDTWLDLYRYTLARLKSRKVACVRLDHFGKDTDRGSRGSSAKTQDVDAVWELSEQQDGSLLLNRTHTRSGHGEGMYVLRRHGVKVAGRWKSGETRHEVIRDAPTPTDQTPVAVTLLAAKLHAAGIPATWGRDRVATRCAELKIATGGNVALSAAIKYRKTHPDLSVKLSVDDLGDGQVLRTGFDADSSRTGQTKSQVTPVRDSFTDSSRTGDRGPVRPSPSLPIGREDGQGHARRVNEDASCVGCFRATDLRDATGTPRCDRCMPLGDGIEEWSA